MGVDEEITERKDRKVWKKSVEKDADEEEMGVDEEITERKDRKKSAEKDADEEEMDRMQDSSINSQTMTKIVDRRRSHSPGTIKKIGEEVRKSDVVIGAVHETDHWTLVAKILANMTTGCAFLNGDAGTLYLCVLVLFF
uniref:Uncharacterized protein n=1 Tax=Branchiostoma floridae TaxID=7739 RepID=C3Y8Q2_BRAFL|eukprot:XP_002607479.1 hypothetical protein BRAFLDRAFT_69911 [Branchiostoma floridae]